jgi:hypothetical protein
MRRSIGGAILAVTLMSTGSPAISFAVAALARPGMQPQAAQATTLHEQRRIRHHAPDARTTPDRPYSRYYDDRPHDYAPAPFVPFNYGYGLWW